MRLSELLAALPPHLAATRVEGDDPLIRGIQYDSRAIAPGDLFVALRGESSDGHDYLRQARELGAVAFLVEGVPPGFELQGRALACVPDTRRALAPVATRFFGQPGTELALIGITGTNGKTSTSFLVESILAAARLRVGVIGTVEMRWADVHQRSVNTTPESLDLQRTLRTMRSAGISHVAMEVSSHGLALGRVEGCRFAVGAVTNLTQDHLDFHDSMESYREAKALLFRDYLAEGAAAVVNLDDPSAGLFLEAARGAGARVVRVTRRPGVEAEVGVEEASVSLAGTRARLRLPSGPLDVSLPLLGDFNVENALVAVGVALGLGVTPEVIARGLAACPQVPGRVQRVGAELSGVPTVLVDYAHTPDAVEKLLRTLRPLARGRLVTVFGCGGDRDRGKRPLMAQAVAALSDRAVATSDNPRSEDPERILDDVERGLGKLRRVAVDELDSSEFSWTRVTDRREAIELAVRIARPDDTVVIAGKGHEDYQIIGKERLPFDDCREALRALRRRVS